MRHSCYNFLQVKMKILLSVAIAFCFITSKTHAKYCQSFWNPGSTFHEDFAYIRIYCRYLVFEESDIIEVDTYPEYVKVISFQDNNIEKLPSKIFEHFFQTRIIYLNKNNVNTIDKDAFQNVTELISLHLAENEIEVIEDGTFRNLSNLRTLNLSKNKLQTLYKLSLYGLYNLEELNLAYNKIMEIQPNVFQAVPLLRSLNLDKNRLYEVQSDSFAHIPYLFRLSLQENFINYVPDVFQNQSGLNYLDLSKNFLTTFNFENLPKVLKVLNVSSNNISPPSTLISNIETIDYSNNSLTEINIGKSVKTLYINNNQLEFLNQSNFESAVDLNHLIISNNKIIDIEKDLFKNLLNLELLDLSNNNIANIPVGSFQTLHNLWELNLSNNSLSSLEFGTFSGLDNLTELYLDNNRLIEIPETSFYVLRKLKLLHLNNNLLNNLDINELLKEVPSINTITLSNNRWSCKSLFNILDELASRKVGFYNGSKTNIENVNGIACTDRDWYVADSPKEDFIDLKTSKLNQYFEKDFKNSSFYQFFQTNFTDNLLLKHLQNSIENNRFFKYFKHKMGKTDFFKFFNIKDNGKTQKAEKEEEEDSYEETLPTKSTLVNNDYYYAEPLASALSANEVEKELNQEFMSFANKVTICVIVNIGMILLLIFFIVIVFICRNRRHV